jgi:uncharacterized phosphosugar-binding protein/N-acetylglucosamine kinase-like BadF-type ATPase
MAAGDRKAVGVDGGKSGIRLQIVGTSDVVTVPGEVQGLDLAERLADAVADAWAATDRPPVSTLVAGLTAVPADQGERDWLARRLAEIVDAEQVIIVDDALTAHAAAFSGRPGIVVAIGTGMVALGSDGEGLWARAAGDGHLLGDAGGGFALGQAGLTAALRAADGRGAPTSLLASALSLYDATSDSLADRIHQVADPVATVSSFALTVVGAADTGDPLAAAIVDAAISEMSDAAVAVAIKLGSSSLPVVAVGGLTGITGLRESLRLRLSERLGEVSVELSSASPLDGACLLASDPSLAHGPGVLARTNSHSGSARDLAAVYVRGVQRILAMAVEEEKGHIRSAGAEVARRLIAGGMIHTFGSGHSHMLAEEIFYRAGGLARVNPILIDDLMLHESASESTRLERVSGRAAQLLSEHPIEPGDVLIIASNSGGNRVAVELAEFVRSQGTFVIAVTSLAHATSPQARATGGVRLHEVADCVLDNHGVVGDALVPVSELDRRVGPTSTVAGAALLEALVCQVVGEMLDRGHVPEVFASSNTDGGDEINAVLLDRYRGSVSSL